MAPNQNDPPAPGGGQGMSKREALAQLLALQFGEIWERLQCWERAVYHRRAAAIIEYLSESQGWQPIETAPIGQVKAMSDDLVKRLRDGAGLLKLMDQHASERQSTAATQRKMLEAADEIERLREALEGLLKWAGPIAAGYNPTDSVAPVLAARQALPNTKDKSDG